MSCFIVTENFMNETINFIYARTTSDTLSEAFSIEMFQKLGGLNSLKEEVLQRFSHYLYDWNTKSWNTRYPDNQEVYLDDFIQKFSTYKPISLAQFFKNLDCYAYQTCEVESWEGSEIQEVIYRLKNWAISLIDGYEQAAWGGTK